MEYTIGEVAQMKGIAVSALRYYDERGLLPYVKRTPAGDRIFSEQDLEWVGMVAHLKRAGLSLSEIKQFIDFFMGKDTLDKRLDMFLAARKMVNKKIENLQESLELLNYKCWFYEEAIKSGSIDGPLYMKYEDMPEEMRELKELLIERDEDNIFFL